MGIILAFAPFLIFVVVERLAGIPLGLVAAAIVSAVLLLRDAISPKRPVKVLEMGTLLLFGGLAAFALLTGAAWSIPGVRLGVDAGLLLIVLLSIGIRKPFTLQYAREQVSPKFWESPQFIRTNYVITVVWAAAFAIMVIADLVMLYVPNLPTYFSILVTVFAIWCAAKFTLMYPDRVKSQDQKGHAGK
jgi:hypothetical protein